MATKLLCPLPGVPCFDPADPITNFSTETEDSASFLSSFRDSFGNGFGTAFINPGATPISPFPPLPPPDTPGTPGVTLPPLGQYWIAEACGEFCVSDESQLEANVCAYNLSQTCLPDIWTPPIGPFPGTPNPNPIVPVGNQPQSCTVSCPDGSPFTYTVVAGYFKAPTLAQANSIARSFACSQAKLNRPCFGSIGTSLCCTDEDFNTSIPVQTSNPPITFDIVSGSLPPGLVEQTSTSGNVYLISGVPSAAGTFPFTLRATDSLGFVMTKSFTIKVIGIATDSLPEATPGGAYSATLTAEGPTTGTITWTVFA